MTTILKVVGRVKARKTIGKAVCTIRLHGRHLAPSVELSAEQNVLAAIWREEKAKFLFAGKAKPFNMVAYVRGSSKMTIDGKTIVERLNDFASRAKGTLE